jgi:hypothetical protein
MLRDTPFYANVGNVLVAQGDPIGDGVPVAARMMRATTWRSWHEHPPFGYTNPYGKTQQHMNKNEDVVQGGGAKWEIFITYATTNNK